MFDIWCVDRQKSHKRATVYIHSTYIHTHMHMHMHTHTVES